MQGTGRMAKADIEAEFIRHLERIELMLSATGWLVGSKKQWPTLQLLHSF
jgi:glutathione S-transferase